MGVRCQYSNAEWVYQVLLLVDKSLYLKLDDSVLIYVNVPGGNGVLSKLTGNKHHR